MKFRDTKREGRAGIRVEWVTGGWWVGLKGGGEVVVGTLLEGVMGGDRGWLVMPCARAYL